MVVLEFWLSITLSIWKRSLESEVGNGLVFDEEGKLS